MRVAITGAGGRLGRALVAALGEAAFVGPRGPLAWSRPDYDLDDPGSAARCLDRDRPEVVVHAAAWTDVDGCARDPERAMRRNALAVAELAQACTERAVDLVLVSTNEVFDGRRTDGRGYGPEDRPAPGNPYGSSKLAGETAAQAAFLRAGGAIALPAEPVAPTVATGAGDRTVATGAGDVPAAADPAGRRPAAPQLAIVRTAWLFGPPGNDFPTRILLAADRARAAGEPLSVVGDEIGSPTYAVDLAEGIVELLGAGTFAGTHHLVNSGHVSRAAWARSILVALGQDVPIREVPLSSWVRPSSPPPWAVLEPTPMPSGEPLRPWELAFADYVPRMTRGKAAAPR